MFDAMLCEDMDAPRKHRHTAKPVFDRLLAGHGVSMSISTLWASVQYRRPPTDAEAGIP